MLIEWRRVRDGNGNGGLNEDTARTRSWASTSPALERISAERSRG